MELLPKEWSDRILADYLSRVTTRSRVINWIIIIIILTAMLSLPFIYVDVAVRSHGFLQSDIERQPLEAPSSGRVIYTNLRMGENVSKGDTLMIIGSEAILAELSSVEQRISENSSAIIDLNKLLTVTVNNTRLSLVALGTQRYLAEYASLVRIIKLQAQSYYKTRSEYLRTKKLFEQNIRKVIGCVPKEIDLFTGSNAENIAPSEIVPDMKRILEVCSSLGMSVFIESTPGGYNTMLSEHGTKLSGGQRQLIVISRAMYPEPEILVLDEATSLLDPITEDRIQHTLIKFKEYSRTLIVIAHSLLTIRNADIIHVLHKGAVTESGTFQELINRKGFFRDMLKHQGLILNHQNEQVKNLAS